MLEMWEQTVRTAARSFELAIHFSTKRDRGPVFFISTFKWRKFLVMVPRGPLTVTERA